MSVLAALGLLWTAVPIARSEAPPFAAIDAAPPELRRTAEDLLLRALDGEALYTIVGGIKPMSSGIRMLRVKIVGGDDAELERVRRACALLRVEGWLEFATYPFSALDGDSRLVEVVVFHRPALRAVLERHRPFFLRLGISPSSEPLEAALAVEYASDPADRHRGYGYLFGYPDFAVDFFVEAQASQRSTGKFVERDFRQIPVHRSETGRFVYAVPKGAAESEEEKAVRQRCLRILEKYRSLRERFIGEGRPGPIALLREWFRGKDGSSSPENADPKAGGTGRPEVISGDRSATISAVGPDPCPSPSSASGSVSVATSTSTRVCGASTARTSRTPSPPSSARWRPAPTPPRSDSPASIWASATARSPARA
ncbi:MAG: hypothetical protein ACK41F_06215 [Fimbriimonadaceae bacterium]